MNKNDLAAFKGFKCKPDQYFVTELGNPVWHGYADSANDAKDKAIENWNDQQAIADDWDRELLGDDYLLLEGHDIGNK